jgi:LDH2 family malate/lactate/ureidoglycolate dehydrogenase
MRGQPGGATIPSGHGYDIDGNRVTNPAVDGLLIVRRMLGFKGSALVQGLSLGGARTTAADIETYLRNRCGIPGT